MEKQATGNVSRILWGSPLEAMEHRARIAHRPTFKLEGFNAVVVAVLAGFLTAVLAMVVWQVRYGNTGPLMVATGWAVGIPVLALWGLLGGRIPSSAAALTQLFIIWAIGIPAVAAIAAFTFTGGNVAWLLIAAPFAAVSAPFLVRYWKDFVVHQRVAPGKGNMLAMCVTAVLTGLLVVYLFWGVTPG